RSRISHLAAEFRSAFRAHHNRALHGLNQPRLRVIRNQEVRVAQASSQIRRNSRHRTKSRPFGSADHLSGNRHPTEPTERNQSKGSDLPDPLSDKAFGPP